MNNTFNERQEQFNRECRLINLKYEYQGYKGTPKWAIVSDYSEKEIMEKYADVVCEYVPFVLLTSEHGEAIKEYDRNEDKFKKRSRRHGHIYDVCDGEFETHHPEFAVDDLEEKVLKEMEYEKLRSAISMLKPIQKQRLIKYFFDGKSSRQIALEEGVNYSAVDKSIYSALENLKKFLG